MSEEFYVKGKKGHESKSKNKVSSMQSKYL